MRSSETASLNDLQSRYLATRDDGAYREFYDAALSVAGDIIQGLLAKSPKCIDPDYRIEMTYNALHRYMERYTRDQDFSARNVRSVLYLSAIHVLYEQGPTSDRRWQDRNISLSPEFEIAMEPKPEHEDIRWALLDIAMGHPDYKHVLVSCYRARSYRAFILHIEAYTPRRWIYDYAYRLHHLYKMTRRRK